MRRTTTIILIVIVLLVVTSFVLAENGMLEVAWYRIAGGGGTSADGAQYALTGTIGQSEAGVMSDGDSFALSGGYWGSGRASLVPEELYLPVVLRPW